MAGSIEEAWFDAFVLESDCDEDFQSVQDGIIYGDANLLMRYLYFF